jgi:hypothetical protein
MHSRRFSVTPAILTLIAVASAGDDTPGIVAPDDIQKGDFLVYGQQASNSIGTPTLVTPSGFTAATSGTGSSAAASIDVKVADGTEGGTTITGMDANFDWHTLTVFRPSRPIKSFTVLSPTFEATSADPAAQVISSGSATGIALVLGAYGAGLTNTPTPSMSPTEDGTTTISGSPEHLLKYKTWHGSPADVTIDNEDSGNRNTLCGCYIQFEYYDDVAADTVSLQSSDSNASTSINVPSTVQPGDALFLFDRASNASGSGPASSPDSGWTELATVTGNPHRFSIYGKIAEISDISSTVAGATGNTTNHHVIMSFRGDRPFQKMTAFSPVSVVPVSTDPADIVITDQSADKIRLHLASYSASGAVSPRNMTPAKDGEVNPATVFYAAYRMLQAGAALANTTVGMDDEGTGNTLLAVGVELT